MSLEAKDKTIEETKATSTALESQVDATKEDLMEEKDYHAKERTIHVGS